MRLHIMSIPRSGSSYLHEIISKQFVYEHYFIGEPFNLSKATTEILNEDDYMSEMADKLLMHEHFTTKNHSGHISYMLEKYPYIIHRLCDSITHSVILYRKNILETVLSLVIAYKTHEWQFYSTNTYVEFNQTEFDRALVETVESLKQLVKHSTLFSDNHIVAYEDLTGDPETDYRLAGMGQYGHKSLDTLISQPAAPKSQTVKEYDRWHEYCSNKLQQMQSAFVVDDVWLSDLTI